MDIIQSTVDPLIKDPLNTIKDIIILVTSLQRTLIPIRNTVTVKHVYSDHLWEWSSGINREVVSYGGKMYGIINHWDTVMALIGRWSRVCV